MGPHQRKCHDCGHTDTYQDNIVPECLCRKCGSQDTRLVRTPAKPPRKTDSEKLAEICRYYKQEEPWLISQSTEGTREMRFGAQQSLKHLRRVMAIIEAAEEAKEAAGDE